MNRVILLSAAGYAALACLRAEGPDIRALIGRHFIPSGSLQWNRCRVGELLFGHWEQKDGEEVVVSLLAADAVEIHCHGGAVSQNLLLNSLVAEGCQVVKWEDWLARNSVDAIEKSAKLALSRAKTQRVAMILLDQLQGALHNAIKDVIDQLANQDLQSAATALESLIARIDFGMHLEKGWRVVFIGSPNAGKSSLINALLGYQRSIVLSKPGTTRDVLTATTALEGWPIDLIDTAGLRSSNEPLEEAGMRLAVQEASQSDLVLLVSDASQDWTTQQDRWLSQFPNVLVVHNKQDLAGGRGGKRPEGIETVAISAEGLENLCCQIVRRTVGSPPGNGVAIPFTPGQASALGRAYALIDRQKAAEAEKLLIRLLCDENAPIAQDT